MRSKCFLDTVRKASYSGRAARAPWMRGTFRSMTGPWQTQEIDAAQLTAGEEEALTGERSRLANAEELATLARTALAALDESAADEPTAIDLIGRVVRLADRLAELDPGQRPAAEQARL